jgi:tol-pal system protein YbgF
MSVRRLAALLLVPLLGACATKRDVRDLRDEMAAMRAAQDSAFREAQRENRALLDSIADQNARLRGDLANRFLQVDRQLVQIQELTGQGQQRLQELREQINARAQQDAARQAEAASSAGSDTTSSSGSGATADELYTTSMASLRRGSLQTARAGFQEFLRAYPGHRQAPDALFYVGETYNEGKDVQNALQSYAQVVQRYPTSARAPTALYRAGTIEAGRGNRAEARTLFNRVVQSYARSPEATLARDQLAKLPRS